MRQRKQFRVDSKPGVKCIVTTPMHPEKCLLYIIEYISELHSLNFTFKNENKKGGIIQIRRQADWEQLDWN